MVALVKDNNKDLLVFPQAHHLLDSSRFSTPRRCVIDRQRPRWHDIESLAMHVVNEHASVDAKNLQGVLHLHPTLLGAEGGGPARFAEAGVEFGGGFLVERGEKADAELDAIAQDGDFGVVAARVEELAVAGVPEGASGGRFVRVFVDAKIEAFLVVEEAGVFVDFDVCGVEDLRHIVIDGDRIGAGVAQDPRCRASGVQRRPLVQP